ncbi:retrovirus-related pol polyprotein from transposon TNT 1-94 [Tanacetum coccineum]
MSYPPVGYDISNLLLRHRIDYCSLNNVSILPNNTMYSVNSIRHIDLQQIYTAYSNQLNTVYRPSDAVMHEKDGSEHKDANEHIEIVLEIVDLFHILGVTKDQITLQAFPMSLIGAASRWLRNEPSGSNLVYNGLDVPTRKILDSKGAIPTKTTANTKMAIQEMAEYSQKWHNRTSSKTKIIETFDGLAAIQAQLNNLKREIKKGNKKVYAAQVGCELCKGPHYTKDCPFKEEGKTLEEAYYTQFGTPYQPGGQYKAAGPGFYQHNNGNSSYPDRRQTLEESLTKFIAESAKRHEENSNIIKEIQSSTDAAIRNQGASIKTLEIQIGQMSKVLQKRGFGRPYAVSDSQYSNIFSKTVSFSRRLHGYCCDWKEAREVKILETYDTTLPQKEKDPGSFTLLCFIHNVCFDKALVDLVASVSVIPFSAYTNLGLGDLAYTRLTIELADRVIKHPWGIAENVLVRIGEAINESFDPHYGNYIKLNDLDMPLEPRMDQDDEFEPTLDLVNKPTYKNYHKMNFSCMIGSKHVIADFLPTLSFNMMTKRFYNFIIKDKGNHEGKNLAGTLIDIPIFVEKFSIILGFLIIDDMDITSGVVLGMPFYKKFVSCQKIMERFAHGDECERMDDE